MEAATEIHNQVIKRSEYQDSGNHTAHEELFIHSAQQNPENFEILYSNYFEPLFRFAYQRLPSKDTAFDVTSQVFLKALLNINKYRFTGHPFSSWLFRIAKNEISDYYRKSKKQVIVNVSSDQLETVLDDLDESKEADLEYLAMVLQKLKVAEMELIEMRYFEKRSFREIGQILDISENNAKVKLYRVLDKLKKVFFKNGNNGKI